LKCFSCVFFAVRVFEVGQTAPEICLSEMRQIITGALRTVFGEVRIAFFVFISFYAILSVIAMADVAVIDIIIDRLFLVLVPYILAYKSLPRISLPPKKRVLCGLKSLTRV